ncbi:MAG: ribosomal RNA small subunit methyltransferase A [Candidatus Heimdallarchaeota archaeon]|nr:ribosomal RNA small subunit methyltransferase A [Candidatus Heimdallarchaeota archaeon]
MKDWHSFTRKILPQIGLKASKEMGQNFLIKYKVVHDMVQLASIKPNDSILEIGGGLGILTDALSKSTNNLTVIEKDKRLAEYLNEAYPNVEIILGDALDIDWPKNDKLIANLPYSISSPILKKIIHQNISMAVVMVQKEIANRCIAKPGSKDYGRLSILCDLHVDVKKLFTIGPDSFYPRPKVDSSVIMLERKSVYLTNSHEEIELLATNLFTLKRRILRSVIRGFLKRRRDDDIWDEVPYKDKRIIQLSTKMLDEILSFLKDHDCWPLA